MTLVFADTSALVRAYFKDEPDHRRYRTTVFESGRVVVASRLARVEFARAVTAAGRARRFRRTREMLIRFDEDCSAETLRLVQFRPDLLDTAYRLLQRHRVGTMDALHLAAALDVQLVAGERVEFLTADADQALAARTEGLEVAA